MLRYLLLFFCTSSLLFAQYDDDDWDEDEDWDNEEVSDWQDDEEDWEEFNEEEIIYEAPTLEISYGGITLFCNQGCGDAIPGSYRQLSEEAPHLIERLGDTLIKEPTPVWFRLGYLSNVELPRKAWGDSFDSGSFGIRRYPWENTQGFFRANQSTDYYPVKTYPQFLELASLLRRDLYFYCISKHEQYLSIYKKALEKLEACKDKNSYDAEFSVTGEIIFRPIGAFLLHPPNVHDSIRSTQNSIMCHAAVLEQELAEYDSKQTKLEEVLQQIDSDFYKIFIHCLKTHQKEGILFQGAIEYFLNRDFDFAMQQVRSLIEIFEENHYGDELLAKLYLLKGEVDSEFGCYAEAIIDLTTAIEKNPLLQEAYFERAVAYFELGDFDKSIEDYLVSGVHSRPMINPSQLALGLGMGLVQGSIDSTLDFLPSTLGILRGISNGLWALGTHPLQASQDFVQATSEYLQFLKTHSTKEILQEMVPELKELLTNYDQLEDLAKGRLIGTVIGKYGMDILLMKEGAACIKAYRNLRKANQVMTLEALASPETTQAILKEAGQHAALRETTLKHANLKIQPDKQGKHIPGHKNYQQLINDKRKPSILVHSDPEKLVREHAGRGIKDRGDLPGMPGYKEIVDCEEFIGYAVNPITGEKVATTWGKIHYATDGTHIVPTLPPTK